MFTEQPDFSFGEELEPDNNDLVYHNY